MPKQVRLFSSEEWLRLPQAVRALGQVSALKALCRAGSDTISRIDAGKLSKAEANPVKRMMESWPQPEQELDSYGRPAPHRPIPEGILEAMEEISGFDEHWLNDEGDPRFFIVHVVEECHDRLRLYEQSLWSTDERNRRIDYLIDNGISAPSREVASEILDEIGYEFAVSTHETLKRSRRR